MTGADLQQLLVTRLVQAKGGTRQRWRRVIGEVRVYSPDTHPHCNWDLRPTGGPAEVAAAEEMADSFRARVPQVSAD